MAAPTASGQPLAADPPCCTIPATRNLWPLSSRGVLRRSDPPGVPVTREVPCNSVTFCPGDLTYPEFRQKKPCVLPMLLPPPRDLIV